MTTPHAPVTGWPYRALLDLRALAPWFPTAVKLQQARDCTGPAAARSEMREMLQHLRTMCTSPTGAIALDNLEARVAAWAHEQDETLKTSTRIGNGALVGLSLRPVKPRRTRGPSRRPAMPHEGSRLAAVVDLKVGGYTYMEAATEGEVVRIQRQLAAPARHPGDLKSRRYATHGYTAVGAARLGEVRYLVRVERVE